MLRSVHNCKKLYWGTKWVPTKLVIGGGQPFMRRLSRVSISPMVGSIYNTYVWGKVAAAWVKAGVRRTLEGGGGPSPLSGDGPRLGEWGVCRGTAIVAEWCLVFLCILHCCMARGRLQVAFIEARLGDLPKDTAVTLQHVLYQARIGVTLWPSALTDGEEAQALFLTWEEMGPLLAYARKDDEWQAVVAMRNLLRDLYSDTPPHADLQAAEVARAYRLHCCKAGCQSDYLFYLEEDVTLAVANAARLGVGLGAVCADVVESLNAVLKQAYNAHMARWRGVGGGCRGLRHLNGRRMWFYKCGSGGF